jgi:hypothetical protein
MPVETQCLRLTDAKSDAQNLPFKSVFKNFLKEAPQYFQQNSLYLRRKINQKSQNR